MNIDDYIKGSDKLILVDYLGYKYNITIGGLRAIKRRNGDLKKCRFGNNNPFALENMRLALHINNINYKILSDNINNVIDDLDFKCPNNHKFNMSWHEFYNSEHRCPVCALQNKSGKNHWKYNSNLSIEEREKKRLYLAGHSRRALARAEKKE